MIINTDAYMAVSRLDELCYRARSADLIVMHPRDYNLLRCGPESAFSGLCGETRRFRGIRVVTDLNQPMGMVSFFAEEQCGCIAPPAEANA